MSSLAEKSNESSRRLSVTLAVPILSCVMMGCFYGFQHKDVLTSRKEYWGGFPPGQVYQLVQDAFCMQDAIHVGLFLSDHYYSEARHQMFKVKQYQEDGINEGIQIIPAGTRIRCSQIVGYRGGGLAQIGAYGVFLDGLLTGKEVDFGYLADAGDSLPRALPYSWTLQPRPEFLQPVSPTGQTTPPK